MATYLILVIGYIGLVMLVLGVRPTKPGRGILLVLLALCVLTAIFDSVIVGQQLVVYDASKNLGLRIGRAPIEDFGYPLLAVIIVPVIWRRLDKTYSKGYGKRCGKKLS